MKTNFWKFAAAFVGGLSAAVACQKDPEPEKIAPVFPSEVIEQNVEAGATVEVTFDANQDWELSIPAAEQNKYWLDDAGVPASKVTGKAGAQTVSVVFSEDQYYDANVLCEVTLSMGGQSKVIAKYTRLAINRTLEVYVAEKSDWGFKSTYVTEKATSLELVTFEGDVTYTQRIKVLANFNWNLSLPEWCEGQIKVAAGETAPESLSGTAGQAVEIELVGKLTAAVKAGASDFARFIDAADNTKSYQLALTLPAFENRLEVTVPNTMEFAGDGSADGMSVGYVLGMDGFVVRALEWDAEGGYHICHSYADWVTVNFANVSEGEDIFVQKSFTLGVEVNNGAARCADIFVFPASMAETDALSICVQTDHNCGIKPDYEKYCIGRLTQDGKTAAYISELNDMMSGAETYKASLTTYESSQWWASLVGGLSVTNQYELTYWDQRSELTLLFDSPFAEVKIFDYDFVEVVGADLDTFWLWFTNWSDKGKVMMDPNLFNNPNAASPESFIVFYDEAGKALAGICCKYEAAPSGGETSTPISVQAGSAEVAVGVSGMGLPDGFLNQIISGLGVGTAQTEMLITASTAEVEFTANFNISQIFVLNTEGQTVSPAGFTCYQSSYTDFKVTAASGTECILLFMDNNGTIPVVAYYSYY